MLNFNTNQIRFISYIYLLLSFAIFSLSWVKIPITLLYILILAYSTYIFWKDTFQSQADFIKISLKTLFICSIILIFWIALSGVGGLGLQTGDYLKHNALSYDLITNTHPPEYNINGKTYHLVHYLGYYLTPAFVGKFLGWSAFNYANILWTSLGILLSIFWFIRIVGKFSWFVLLIFILFGGLRLAGALYQFGLNGTIETLYNAMYGTVSLFSLNSTHYSFSFIYHNTTDLIYWSPQHTLGAWIGAGLLLHDWLHRKNISMAPIYLSLIAFWSPWSFIGLCPFALVAVFQLKYWQRWFSLPAILSGLAILVLTIIFLLGVTDNNLIHHFIFNNMSISGSDNATIFQSYLFFICFEVLIYTLPILILMYIQKNTYFTLTLLLTIVLVLVPLYRYGQWNDWCAKVGVPAQFIMAIVVTKMILQKTKLSYYLIIVFLLSAIVPLTSIVNSFRYARHFKLFNYPAESKLVSLPQTADNCNCWPKEQFIAPHESLFFKYFSK